MKKPAIILGSAVVIVVACVLLFWRHATLSRFDRDFRQSLTGTWLARLDNMCLTNVVLPDGSFTSHLIFVHPGRINTYEETGTWLVQDGKMIETVKSDTNPTDVTPHSRVGRILYVIAGGFAVRWHGSPDVWAWQKVAQ